MRGEGELMSTEKKPPESLQRRIISEIESTISAYKSVCGEGKVIYCSCPITTGKKLYDRMITEGVNDIQIFKKFYPKTFYNDVMMPNINEGRQFGKSLREDNKNKGKMFIVPGDFYAKDWDQDHYMILWRNIIDKFAEGIRFNKKWYFSNGGIEEYLTGLKTQKKNKEFTLSDYEGKIIKEDYALDKVSKTIKFLEDHKINSSKLCKLCAEIKIELKF